MNRQITYGGGLLPENIRVTISGVTVGSIVTDVTIDYQEPINRIWDLSGGRCFVIAGMPSGTFGIGFIGGGGAVQAIRQFDVCNPGTVSISCDSGLCIPRNVSKSNLSRSNDTIKGKGGQYTLKDVVSGQIRVTASSGNMVINEGVGGIFLTIG